MSKFSDRVLMIVRSIPRGKVVSYGQVALMAGMPRAARQVGWVLNRCDGNSDIPWWRVINNSGRISIKGSSYSSLDQMLRLKAEGVEVSEDLEIDIEKYRFCPDLDILKKYELDPVYIDMLIDRYLL